MTMNRESNAKSAGGGRSASRGRHRSCRNSGGGRRNFLGVRCWSATSLMQIGVWLILVNSIVLCSCTSLSINSQNSISKNTVLGDHEEASVDSGPASVLPVIPATKATTSSSSDDTARRANNNNNNTDTSSEARRKEKKGRISNNSSDGGSYNKDSVRINASNNTTAPEGSAAKPKTATGASAGKEYWNKQQKLATALKEAKKGKYRFNVQLKRRAAGFCRFRHLYGKGPVVVPTEKPFQWIKLEYFLGENRPLGSCRSVGRSEEGTQRKLQRMVGI